MAATTIIASPPGCVSFYQHHKGASVFVVNGKGCVGFGLDSTNKGALGFGSAAIRVRWVVVCTTKSAFGFVLSRRVRLMLLAPRG
ncbi:hypothetical protein Tco_1581277, partial [Tanacetum coccineum]